MTSKVLWAKVENALRREIADDHLTDAERESLVAEYRAENPTRELPNNMTDAFMVILFD